MSPSTIDAIDKLRAFLAEREHLEGRGLVAWAGGRIGLSMATLRIALAQHDKDRRRIEALENDVARLSAVPERDRHRHGEGARMTLSNLRAALERHATPTPPPTYRPAKIAAPEPREEARGASNVTFLVEGTPIPKGSMRGYKRGKHVVITNDNAETRPWEAAVAWHAAMARNQLGGRAEGPVRVSLIFAFDKPKTAPKKLSVKITKPDVDKLARAILDGLTKGGLIRDDALVVELSARKCFTGQHHNLPTPGCQVMVECL